ncbi:glycosyltransferase family 1 protein [Methylosinus sp. Ce-a6]|uniref:glycosyltransferase family 4 protein n=1 Tax=Methylosinus sp. Ce-a6 TaxID=2172005 RepID=UPI0013595624|nr:glycosyltransferase family 1 protein [Methylosinus sp. Ce-a6]
MTGGDRERLEERNRLLEHQLDYLRAELLHLVHEREKNVYSAAWLIFRPLRRVEAALVDALAPLFRRLSRKPAARAAEAPAPDAGERSAAPPKTRARRLLVDVTATARRDAGTGIQRVVKKITQALYRDDSLPIPAIAVRCEGGRLLTCEAFVASLTGGLADADREIAIEPGDRFFMLSDSWNAFEEFQPVFARIRAGGGEIVTCVFDLIPALYPHACHEVTPPRYDAWLRRALVESDAFLAISRTVAEELAAFVEESRLPHRPGLAIGWFHCGSDITEGAPAAPRAQIAAAAAGDAPVFLSVGTLEPRKGHRVALAAFEALWRKGRDARLVFVGRRGWFEEAIAAEILGHAELGRRLFWFDDVGDGELAFLYDKSRAALVPSYAEGFGLPIAEAARRGRPTICSDIPVFREVGGAGALYFRVNDPHALAERIEEFLDGRVTADPAAVSRASWAEAARRVVQAIAAEDWSKRLP